MGDSLFDVTFGDPWTPLEEQILKNHGGLIIQTDANEYFVGGSGVTITVETNDSETGHVGIARIEEGQFVNREWERGRVLNGDESHQGGHLRIPPKKSGIQRLKLYRCE